MTPIAVWYHCKLEGHGIPDEIVAAYIVSTQMSALKESGLSDAASEIHIGVNGTFWNPSLSFLLSPKTPTLYLHGESSSTELPTFSRLRGWIYTHPTWNVCYHHSKGVTQPNDDFHHHHRQVMQEVVIDNWRRCARDLDRGYEAVGCNLVDPDTRPIFPGQRFFAGNFWWAKASYLLTLPPLPKSVPWNNRCVAEQWIGMSKRKPIMLDYHLPHLYQHWVSDGLVKP